MSRPIEDYFVSEEKFAEFEQWKTQNPIRLWRNERGYTVSGVARCTGIHPSDIFDYEDGRRRPRDVQLERIEQFTKIDGLIDKWREWELQCPILNRPQIG